MNVSPEEFLSTGNSLATCELYTVQGITTEAITENDDESENSDSQGFGDDSSDRCSTTTGEAIKVLDALHGFHSSADLSDQTVEIFYKSQKNLLLYTERN